MDMTAISDGFGRSSARSALGAALLICAGATPMSVLSAQQVPPSRFARTRDMNPSTAWQSDGSHARPKASPPLRPQSDSADAGPYVLIGAAVGGTLGYFYARNRFPTCNDCIIGRGYLVAATTVVSALGGYAVGGIVFLVRRETERRAAQGEPR